MDALLFVTPEYNRSIPGGLKNALDVGSRPAGANVFDGLPAAIVSVTPYSLGAFGANHALRQSFVYLNLRVMQRGHGQGALVIQEAASAPLQGDERHWPMAMSVTGPWQCVRAGIRARSW